MGQVLDQDALYYPYMRIRDVNWLRTNLVLFPHVFRMVPEEYEPEDDPAVRPFLEAEGSRGALLAETRLQSCGVYDALGRLAAKFAEESHKDLPSLQRRYGREATTAATAGGQSFVINAHKAVLFFQQLLENGLAWPGRSLADMEVHPRVGEAIMMTLAIASAQDGGLQVVTDNGAIHRCLAERDLEGAVEHWLSDHPSRQVETNVERRLALAVIERISLDELTPEKLAALSKEWEPRGRFLMAIRKLAWEIPEMRDDARLREYIEQRADSAIHDWEKDKANLSSFVRQIFPAVGKTSFADAAKRVAESMAGPVAAGAVVGSMSRGDLIGIGAGIGIGCIVEMLNLRKEQKEREANSPYRYLSMVQQVGISYSISR